MAAMRLAGAGSSALPQGAMLRPLRTHADPRGDLTEVFRNQWLETPPPQQWNLLRNRPNVLRGMHVHLKHWDYSCVVAGQMLVALHDLRAAEPRSIMLELDAERLQVLTIPPGIAHSFYSGQAAVFLVGASGYYDSSDHRRCRWNCPELGLHWPCTAPILSPEDASAGGYAALKAEVRAAVAGM